MSAACGIPSDALLRTEVAIRGHDEPMMMRSAEDPTVFAGLLDPYDGSSEDESQVA
jgi:hypothetical protein